MRTPRQTFPRSGRAGSPVLGGLPAAIFVAFALMLAACGDDSGGAADAVGDNADQIESSVDENSSELADALRDRGLDSIASAVESVDLDELVGDGEFTFLAPNNDAFLSLDADTTADLLTDPARILETLQNHVVTERLDSAELAALDEVTTRAGNTLAVSTNGATVMVGPATVTESDIEVGEGVVHVVDTLLTS